MGVTINWELRDFVQSLHPPFPTRGLCSPNHREFSGGGVVVVVDEVGVVGVVVGVVVVVGWVVVDDVGHGDEGLEVLEIHLLWVPTYAGICIQIPGPRSQVPGSQVPESQVLTGFVLENLIDNLTA